MQKTQIAQSSVFPVLDAEPGTHFPIIYSARPELPSKVPRDD